jgi:hypothetical protein
MNKLHLPDQVSRPGVFIHDKQHITNVYHNIPANGGVIVDIAHRSFPNPVEIDPNKVPVSIQRRASRISARGMVHRDKADRHFACCAVLAIILRFI